MEIAVSEVWAGEISEGDSIQKMLPLWYAEKLKVGDQCLFLTEHPYDLGMFFDIMKMGSENTLIPFVTKEEVPDYAEKERAFQELPKTLDEAKAIVEEMQALKQSSSSGEEK